MNIRSILDRLLHGKRSDEPEPAADRKLWMRLGVSFFVTKEEEAVIFANDGRAEELLRALVKEGRFRPDGDTYIPGPTVEEYNETYGTDYEPGDVNFDL